MRRIILGAILLGLSGGAGAYCEGGRYPNITIAEELKESDFVIVGRLESRMLVVDPVEDPQGYEAVLYKVKIEQVLHGQPPEYATKMYLTIVNENSSARFPIYEKDIGKEYLMFVYSGPDGYWVNSCGNSDELSKSKEKIDQIKGLTAKPESKSRKAGSGPPASAKP
jgi:hypothetical protein